uniref:Androgen-induced 1 n=1 Tax=Glossina brevipalpis TaxID=37001 RepID=A0A1A9WK81_9MUSC
MKKLSADPVYKGIYGSLCILIHLVAAVQFWYAVYFDHVFVVFATAASFGGKLKFLTFLDAIIQAVYFTIALINDFMGTNEVSPKRLPLIRKLKDYMMATFAFPLALNVGITFWSIYAIDRELILPKVLDAVFPSWLNHIMHTNIVVFMILEIFTSFRAYPKRGDGMMGLSIFLLAYLVWLHIVKYYSGLWAYPFLELLSLPQRLLFFIGSLAINWCLYVLGETMNNMIWNKELKMAYRKTN